jgi:hypothetical protein
MPPVAIHGRKPLPHPEKQAAMNSSVIVPARALVIAAIALFVCVAGCSSVQEQTKDHSRRLPTTSIDQIKPISGTWFNFQCSDQRHKYTNECQAAYTCDDWALKVNELAEIGIRYIIFQSVALGGKAFYKSALMPGAGLVCDDPLGASIEVFLSCEFVNNEDDDIYDSHIMEGRIAIMSEVAAQFSASPAFCGWYFSAEGDASVLFDLGYFQYVNRLAYEARKLTPGAKILIAPYGLNLAKWSEKYLRQLESMDIDIIAYQDKVGCIRSLNPIELSSTQFAAARRLHDRIPRIELWADIETFTWEGDINSRASALVPAPFSRVLEQMAAVSPHVESIVAFTMQGMADKPGSPAPTGHPTAAEQYRQYEHYLNGELDMLVLADAIAGRLRHAAIGARVILNSNAESGEQGARLVDGSTASIYNQREGWIVFKDGAIDVTVDLGRRKKIDYIGIHLLADRSDSVFVPEHVNFALSADGTEYVSVGDVDPYPWCPTRYDTRREIITAPRTATKARYVRIRSQGVIIPKGVEPRDTTILASEIIINPKKHGVRVNRRLSIPVDQ